jgi:hypothetical protein
MAAVVGVLYFHCLTTFNGCFFVRLHKAAIRLIEDAAFLANSKQSLGWVEAIAVCVAVLPQLQRHKVKCLYYEHELNSSETRIKK